MDHSIVRVTTQNLAFILSQLESSSKVVWARNADYSRQLYISASYEKIWGRSCEQLYEHPLSWSETLAIDETKQVIERLKARHTNENTEYYRIHIPDGHLYWIKDICFHLFDQTGQKAIVAGVAEVISQSQWEKEQIQPDKNAGHPTNILVQSEIAAIFNKELKLTAKENVAPQQDSKNIIKLMHHASGLTAQLTPRETECLFYLSSGQSAKRIARTLAIAPRTVDVHIENIKRKLACRTRIELISKLIHNE